jgi:hypothetical protein
MQVHVPKPLHGWRAFAGEVGIIVLGVLIALGAGQMVETVHERSEAFDADSAIRGELEFNMARLRSRWEQRACVRNRLDELQSLIDLANADGGAIPTPSWVGRPQFWTMQMSRWQATSQAGRAAMLPAGDLALYGSMYSYLGNVNGAMAEEQADWARLRSLEHLKRLTPQMVFDLDNTLQDARYLNWRIGVWTQQLQSIFNQLRLKVIQNGFPASRSVCIPMGTSRAQAMPESNSPYGDEP